ncbi:hypothetical protein NMY22_g6591 [Coprinellus aureogranulatus]|nr:hypothetical protein NMY22_g6591 [Coprinellus aureogranulatus]
MPATSTRHSTSSPNEIPSSSKHTKSKPIRIPGTSTKSKVIIVLPPQMHPPALASSPSHRTAPNPQPVLISSSYPGRRRVGSLGSSSSAGSTPPAVTYTVNATMTSSSLPKSRPTFLEPGPSPSSIPHQRPRHSPSSSNGSGGSPPNASHVTRVTVTGPALPSGSIPIARATSVDAYSRSTVTRGGC